MGLMRWGGESEEWVVHVPSDLEDQRPFDDAGVLEDVREALGIGDHLLDVKFITRWTSPACSPTASGSAASS